jgi:hypothetical protein
MAKITTRALSVMKLVVPPSTAETKVKVAFSGMAKNISPALVSGLIPKCFQIVDWLIR